MEFATNIGIESCWNSKEIFTRHIPSLWSTSHVDFYAAKTINGAPPHPKKFYSEGATSEQLRTKWLFVARFPLFVDKVKRGNINLLTIFFFIYYVLYIWHPRCSTRFSCELIISKTLQSRAPIELDPEFRATKENLQENHDKSKNPVAFPLSRFQSTRSLARISLGTSNCQV